LRHSDIFSIAKAKPQALALRKVAQALKPGGTVAIAEFIANHERTGPPQALLFAVNMLVNSEEGDV
jgi:hypothetical protein